MESLLVWNDMQELHKLKNALKYNKIKLKLKNFCTT